MKKEMEILKVAKTERCTWDEAVKKIKERKTLKEFF